MQTTTSTQRLEARRRDLARAGVATLLACGVFALFTAQYLAINVQVQGIHIPAPTAAALPQSSWAPDQPDLGLTGTIRLGAFAATKIAYLLLLPALVFTLIRRRWLSCLSVVTAFHVVLFFSDTSAAQLNQPVLTVPAETARALLDERQDQLPAPDAAYIRLQLGPAPAGDKAGSAATGLRDALGAQRLYQITGNPGLIAGCSTSHCWDHSGRRRALAASVSLLTVSLLAGIALLFTALILQKRLNAVSRVYSARGLE